MQSYLGFSHKHMWLTHQNLMSHFKVLHKILLNLFFFNTLLHILVYLMTHWTWSHQGKVSLMFRNFTRSWYYWPILTWSESLLPCPWPELWCQCSLWQTSSRRPANTARFLLRSSTILPPSLSLQSLLSNILPRIILPFSTTRPQFPQSFVAWNDVHILWPFYALNCWEQWF